MTLSLEILQGSWFMVHSEIPGDALESEVFHFKRNRLDMEFLGDGDSSISIALLQNHSDEHYIFTL